MPGFLIILAMTSWPMATVSAPHALRLAAGVPGSVGWAGFGGGIAAGMLGTAGATGAGTGRTGRWRWNWNAGHREYWCCLFSFL